MNGEKDTSVVFHEFEDIEWGVTHKVNMCDMRQGDTRTIVGKSDWDGNGARRFFTMRYHLSRSHIPFEVCNSYEIIKLPFNRVGQHQITQVRLLSGLDLVHSINSTNKDGLWKATFHWPQQSQIQDFCLECDVKVDLSVPVSTMLQFIPWVRTDLWVAVVTGGKKEKVEEEKKQEDDGITCGGWHDDVHY